MIESFYYHLFVQIYYAQRFISNAKILATEAIPGIHFLAQKIFTSNSQQDLTA
jgi:hypothetical protein